jgi:hypothetical protein
MAEACQKGETMEKVKTIKNTGAQRLHQRMIIKSVPDAHGFLNKQYDNTWSIYEGPLKAGIYVFAGGEWRNVKSIDPSALAHM